MPNNYSLMISKGMNVNKDEVNKVCVRVLTYDTLYNFAFIDYEDDDCLGVSYTVDDGTERFVIINKQNISDIEIIYADDLQQPNDEQEENVDMMFQ